VGTILGIAQGANFGMSQGHPTVDQMSQVDWRRKWKTRQNQLSFVMHNDYVNLT